MGHPPPPGYTCHPDCWWACDHPERPHDPTYTMYEACCYPCGLAMGANAINDPTILTKNTLLGDMTLAQSYEAMRHWCPQLPPLPLVTPAESYLLAHAHDETEEARPTIGTRPHVRPQRP